jgi:predicted transcriptional regulator/DNA-binding XRE family transcriptional regulator
MNSELDLLVLGQRVRHARRERGLTLAALGEIVGRPAPYLSRLENGKVEPKLGFLTELAAVLETSSQDLLGAEPPDRRSDLELRIHRAQLDPRYRALALAPLKPTARVPDEVLEHLVALWDLATGENSADPSASGAGDVDRARRANQQLRDEMRGRDNYFREIEEVAATALARAGYGGQGPLSERVLTELVASYGFTIERVTNMPRAARSITDTRDRIIFIADIGGLKVRQARSVVLQTLGHFALEHTETTDFGDYLRQRIESNYFAAAVLAPEAPAVEFLLEAKAAEDISVEDLKEQFYISYEMSAHRFTNLATVHLGLPVHFYRTDSEGVITKAYENDGLDLPMSDDGALEGERVPRQWGSRQAWNSHGSFLLHEQYTVTDAGEFFCVTYIETETDRNPYAVSVGTRSEHASVFRGSDTLRREFARSSDVRPDTSLAREWEGVAWPSAAERSHVLSILPPSARTFTPFPGIDLHDVYRFLDRQRRTRRGRVAEVMLSD